MEEPETLSADDVDPTHPARDERPSSSTLLCCERCGKRVYDSFLEASRATRGWQFPLHCEDCESWWHSL